MVAVASRCMNVIRELPHGSGIDIPWTLIVERLSLDKGSLVFPIVDISEENLKQTVGRIAYALMLFTPFCKIAAGCNTALGLSHLVWCVCNIKKFQSKELDRKELEKSFIRLSTAVYDLVLIYLFSPYFIGSGYLKGVLLLSLIVSPQQALQLHHAIFAKAVIQPAKAAEEEAKDEDKEKPREIDHFHLKDDCLIQVFSRGLTDTWLPPEAQATWRDRLWALPSGMGSYASSLWRWRAAANVPPRIDAPK
jgi:hypothetical protein